jgi:hypothetical protein
MRSEVGRLVAAPRTRIASRFYTTPPTGRKHELTETWVEDRGSCKAQPQDQAREGVQTWMQLAGHRVVGCLPPSWSSSIVSALRSCLSGFAHEGHLGQATGRNNWLKQPSTVCHLLHLEQSHRDCSRCCVTQTRRGHQHPLESSGAEFDDLCSESRVLPRGPLVTLHSLGRNHFSPHAGEVVGQLARHSK